MALEELKGVEILCKSTAETLQQQNAEFIAKYPTDDAQIDYYTDLAMKLFEEFEIDGDWDVEGTRKNVETWYANKKEQMERFRKHPYWNEEAKAIIFQQEEVRTVRCDVAQDLINNLRGLIYEHTRNLYKGDKILAAIRYVFYLMKEYDHICDGTIDEYFVDKMNDYLKDEDVKNINKDIARMLVKGTKITRFVRKCCEKFEMNSGKICDMTAVKYNDNKFEKIYAKLADALSILSVQKMTLLSLHFCDFMTMSNGNSWSTCHFINSHGIFHDGDAGSSYHGMYKQGCLSYALDKPSFIFYTLPTDYDGNEYYRVQKLTRMCCQYDDGILITGKCYPSNEYGLIERYRQTMQMILAHIEEVPNLWTFSKNASRIQAFVQTHRNASHYQDYVKQDQKPTISLCRHHMSADIDNPMIIGHQAYCVYCGTGLSVSGKEWLQCEMHRKKMKCQHCGKRIARGAEYQEIGDYLYCSDCYFYCAVHGVFEPISQLHATITMKDGEQKVCRNAMSRLKQCADCGIYELKRNMLRTENGYVCKKHSRKYKQCSWCGVYIPNKEKYVDGNGNVMCQHCHKLFSDKGVVVVKTDSYEVGDYVVFADEQHIDRCSYGANETMMLYANRISLITHANNDTDFYKVENIQYELSDSRWNWDRKCFAYKIIGATTSGFIGKTLAELGLEVEEN